MAANPIILTDRYPHPAWGHDITLRDLFAAFAIAGRSQHGWSTGDREEEVRNAYKLADAMLVERLKTPA